MARLPNCPRKARSAHGQLHPDERDARSLARSIPILDPGSTRFPKGCAADHAPSHEASVKAVMPTGGYGRQTEAIRQAKTAARGLEAKEDETPWAERLKNVAMKKPTITRPAADPQSSRLGASLARPRTFVRSLSIAAPGGARLRRHQLRSNPAVRCCPSRLSNTRDRSTRPTSGDGETLQNIER